MKVGRPTALTQKVHDKIVEVMREGNYAVTACALARIDEKTFYNWMNRGEDDASSGDDTIYSVFFQSVKDAASEAEQKALQEVKKGEQNWQSRAWFLERRYADRWGRTERKDVTIRKRPSEMTESEIDDELEEILRQRRSTLVTNGSTNGNGRHG